MCVIFVLFQFASFDLLTRRCPARQHGSSVILVFHAGYRTKSGDRSIVTPPPNHRKETLTPPRFLPQTLSQGRALNERRGASRMVKSFACVDGLGLRSCLREDKEHSTSNTRLLKSHTLPRKNYHEKMLTSPQLCT